MDRLQSAWTRASVVWLSGVRRVGKTSLGREVPDALFLNCDLASTALRVEDPETFYKGVSEPVVIFDEIHQLRDPSRLLKIGADEYPRLKILATGSSTLAATTKFKDSLTGRKRSVHLLPVLVPELSAFRVGLHRRLLHGGLPDALLAPQRDEELYGEWLDSYFARDIQELFRVGKRQEFLHMVEILLRMSGGLLEVTSLGKLSGLSRPTVLGYLEALQTTHVITLVRPFHGGGRQEILRQPKVYGFDTGFVSFYRGWDQLRDRDCGILWEHLVLETLQATAPGRRVHYWRDKRQREVDFVVKGPGEGCEAIECKWDPSTFSGVSLRAFRALHPQGANYVISPQTESPHVADKAGLKIVYCGIEHWSSGEAMALAGQIQS